MFNRTLVIGAGTMGCGVASLLALKGINVTLVFNDRSKISLAETQIKKHLQRLCRQLNIEFDFDSFNSRIEKETVDNVSGIFDFVFEAITEDISKKKALFDSYKSNVASHTIWASNTSSFSVTDMASCYAFPSNFVGLHFFNPVSSMELVEVIPGMMTDEGVLNKCIELCQLLNKVAVKVNDSPGFIVNRLLIPMINEAVSILETKVASEEEIDNAMKLGAHHPLGPLALADLIGNDVCLSIMQTLYKATCDSKYRPAFLLQKMVSAGKLGRKTGQGFYNY